MEYVSRVLLAAQYRGDNAQELLEICQAITPYTGNVWSVQADASIAGELVLREEGASGQVAWWPVDVDVWMVVAPDFGIVGRLSEDDYRAQYRPFGTILGEAMSSQEMKNIIKAVIKEEKG